MAFTSKSSLRILRKRTAFPMPAIPSSMSRGKEGEEG
jgi:hypothetical protein